MSGVIIDVDTSSDKARSDLKQLNKSLADLVLRGNKASTALNGVDSDQFKKVGQEVDRTNRQLRAFGTTGTASLRAVAGDTNKLVANMNLLKGSIIGVAAAFVATRGVTAFARVGDDLENIRNRLKLVTQGTAELTQSQRALFKTSQDTRTLLKNNADLYFTLSKSLEQTGASQEKIIRLNKTIQQSAQLSGSSVESIAAAITQLNQGIASGVLRGEEFNSVMEQMPYLGIALAKSLNVSVGQLRQFANNGKITTDLLVQQLEKMAASVDKDFTKTTTTASAGLNKMSQAFGYFFGDINTYLGASQSLGKVFSSIADDVGFGADKIIIRLATTQRAFDNYIRSLDAFRSFRLKWQLALDFNPLSLRSQMRAQTKDAVNKIRELFKTQDQIDVPQNIIQRLFSRIKKPTKEDNRGFFDLGDTRKTVEALTDSAVQMTRSVELIARNIARSMPVIIAPMVRFRDSFGATVAKTAHDADTFVYKALLPLNRGLEGLKETLSVGFLGDNFAPRALVSLFKSKDISEFADNLTRLNNTFDGHLIRIDRVQYLIREKERLVKEFTVWPLQDVLIQLGLMDNKLVRIRDTRFDRVIEYMRLIGDMAKRAFNDLVLPDLSNFAYKAAVNVYIGLKTIRDIFSSAFSFETGKALGEALVNGVIGALKTLATVARKLLNNVANADDIGTKIGKTIVSILVGVAKTLPAFLVGVFAGVGSELVHQLQQVDYSAIFDSLKASARDGLQSFINMIRTVESYASGGLAKVERIVSNFGKTIKDVFYNIWDEVVGHSFWPDTIDDVNAYTKNLFHSQSAIEKFGDLVKSAFESVYKKIEGFGQRFGGTFRSLKLTIQDIDWGNTAKNLASSFGSVLYASFVLLRSKSTPIKFFAASYLMSIVDSATGGALTNAAPAIGQAAGVVANEFIKKLLASAMEGVALIGHAIPAMLRGIFLDALPFMEGPLNVVSNLIPIFSNSVIGALAAITIAYSKFSGKKFSDIYTTLFGNGKEGKRRKPGIAPALLEGYSGPILGQLSRVKFTSSLAKNLIDEPKFAAIAAGILSLGLTDAFGMVEAVEASLPFIAIAMFGKDGGARLLRDLTVMGSNLLAGVLGKLAKDAASVVLPAGWTARVSTWLSSPILLFRRVANQQRGPIATALAAIGDDFANMFRNIAANRERYANGELDLKSTLFKSSVVGANGPQQPQSDTNFIDSFKSLREGVSKLQISPNTSLGDFGKKLKDGVTKASSAAIRTIKGATSNLKTVLLSFSAQIFSGLRSGISGFFSAISPILSGLSSLLQNKLFLLAAAGALIVGLASTANAATGAGQAFTDLGGNIGGVVVSTLALAAAFKAVQKSVQAFKTFRSTKKDFVNDAIGGELQNYKDSLNEKRQTKLWDFDKLSKAQRMEQFGTASRGTYSAMLNKGIKEKLNSKEQELRSGVDQAATKAAWDAVTLNIRGFASRLQDLSKATVFSASWWNDRIGKLMSGETSLTDSLSNAKDRFNQTRQAGEGLKAGFSTFFGTLLGSRRASATIIIDKAIVTLRSAVGMGAGARAISGGTGPILIGGVSGAAREAGILARIFRPVGAAFRGAGFAARILGSAAGLLARGLTAVLGFFGLALGPEIIALVGAVTIATGLIAGFFGPFESFTDNIKWLGDNILGFFGMDAKSGAGKAAKLAKDFGVKDVAGQKFDIRDQLKNIDLSQVSDGQQAALQNYLQTITDTISQLNDEAMSQGGKLNDEQKRRFAKLQQDSSEMLARYPLRPGATARNIGDTIAINAADRAKPDTSLTGNLGRFIFGKGDGTGFTIWLSNMWKDIKNVFTSIGDWWEKKALPGIYTASDYVKNAIAHALNKVGDYISNSWLGRAGRAVGNKAQGAFDAVRARAQDTSVNDTKMYNEWEKQFTAKAVKNFAFLSPKQQGVFNNARAEYDQSVRTVAATNRDGQRFGEGKDDFEARRRAELQHLAKVEVAYRRISDALGVLGQKNADVKAFNDSLADFTTKTKALGTDFGTKGEKFFGGKSDVEAFKKYSDQFNKANARLNPTTDSEKAVAASDFTARRIAQQWMKSATEAADEFNKQIADRMLLGSKITQQAGALGDGANEGLLRNFAISGSKAAVEFGKASAEYLRLKTELDKAPSDATPDQLKKIADAVSEAETKMRALQPSDMSFDGINNALQKIQVPSLDMTDYINLPTDQIQALADELKDVDKASKDVRVAMDHIGDTDGPARAKTALEQLRKAAANVAATRAEADNVLTSQIAGAGAIPATLRARLINETAGLGANARALKRNAGEVSKLGSERAKLAADAASIESRISYDGKGGITGVTPAEIARLDAAKIRLDAIGERVNELGQAPKKEVKDRYGFKELLADVNEAGVEISDMGFSRLSQTSRSSLQSIASQIHGIEKQLKNATPTQDVSALLQQKADLLASMREKLVDSFDKTGKALGESLSRSGVGDQVSIEAIATNKLKQLVELDKRIQLKRLEADDVTNLEDYVAKMAQLNKLERERAKLLEDSTNSMDKYAERINSIFGTNLELFNTDLFGEQFAAYISSAAGVIKAQMAKLAAQGKASFGWLREIKQQGEYISLFNDMAQSIDDAFIRGARSAFKKIKDIIPDYGVTEQQFRRFSPEQRQSVTQSAINLDALDRAQELPNLTKPLVDIINSFNGSNQNDVMSRFRTEFEKEFKTKFDATPFESAVDRFSSAVDRFATPPVATGKAFSDTELKGIVTGLFPNARVNGLSRTQARNDQLYADGTHHRSYHVPGTEAGVSAVDVKPMAGITFKDFVKKFKDAGYSVAEAIDESRKSTAKNGGKNWHIALRNAPMVDSTEAPPIVVDGIKTKNTPLERGYSQVYDLIDQAKKSSTFTRQYGGNRKDALAASGIDRKTLDLFTPAQLQTLEQYQKRIDGLNEAILQADTAGEDTSKLAKSLQIAQGSMERFTDRVVHAGDNFRQMGEQFAQSLDKNFQDALFNAFSGKGNFFSTIFDGLAQDILHQATSAITAPITGENGVITNGIRSVFGGGSSGGGIGSAIGGLFGKGSDGINNGLFSGLFGGGDKNTVVPDVGGFASSLNIGNSLPTLDAGSGVGLFKKGGDLLGKDVLGSLDSGASTIGDTLGTGADALSGGIGDALSKGTDSLSKGISGAFSGLGASGAAGLGSLAGGLFGSLIAGFFADGGQISTTGKISGKGSDRSDSILAAVSNDEHIIKAKQARKYRKLLVAINEDKLPKFADGGIVGSSSIGSIIAVPTTSTIDEKKMPKANTSGKTEINLGITGDVTKQTKRTVYEMLPEIAAGVNAHNKEKGIK